MHAFLVDRFGTLYLDTNGDGTLQEPVGTDIFDKPVKIYYDDDLEETKGCIGHIEPNDPATTYDDEVVFFNDDGSCPAIEDLENFDYLWNSSDWLNSSAVGSAKSNCLQIFLLTCNVLLRQSQVNLTLDLTNTLYRGNLWRKKTMFCLRYYVLLEI